MELLRYPDKGKAREQHSACQNHAVHFYDNDVDMCATVAEFVAAGIRAGEPIIAAITPAHRQEINRLLQAYSLNLESAPITWLDAGTALSNFMDNRTPDPQLFKASVGRIVEKQAGGSKPLRVFGEMVDLLVKENNIPGALELERLWNDLGRIHGFPLLCAYAVGKFYRQEHWHDFQLICDQHSEFGGGAVSHLA